MTSAERLVAVPDTDGELYALLSNLEEILIALLPGEDEEPWGLRALDGPARDAAGELVVAVARAERAEAAMPLAPDGLFELVPLRFVTIDETALADVGEALVTIGRALLPGGDLDIAEIVRSYAEHLDAKPHELLADVARAHGLLDLAPDADTELLAGRLSAGGGRVVLTAAEMLAYQRLTERVLGMFHIGDPLARFMYRGLR